MIDRVYFPMDGQLALDSRAGVFNPQMSALAFPAPQVVENGTSAGVVVVTIRGPLMHRKNGVFDSYESVIERVSEALATQPSAIVLDLATPGGQAQGCMETARALRSMCAQADVPLLAYVGAEACSAGYALACAADRIAVTASAIIGSIGVYEMLASQAEAEAAMGLAYRVVSSGTRKTDGNAHLAITDDAVRATEGMVEQLASLFFQLVEDFRGIPARETRALDGAVMTGRPAIAKRLADLECNSIADLVAKAVRSATPPSITTQAAPVAPTTPSATPPSTTPEPSAMRNAKGDALAWAKATYEREDLLAAFAPDDRARLASAPLEHLREEHRSLCELRELVAKRMQAEKMRATEEEMRATGVYGFNPLCAAANVKPTIGLGQGGEQARLPPSARAKLDEQMGLGPKPITGVVSIGNSQLFGVRLNGPERHANLLNNTSPFGLTAPEQRALARMERNESND